MHWLDDAIVFLVYPDSEERGLVRLGGAWQRRGEFGGAMSYKTCPDWPQLMEIAPELQFKHMTVADAQLPFDVLTNVSHVSLGEIEICCDLEHHVFYAAHTDPEIGPHSRGRTGSRCGNGPGPARAPPRTPRSSGALRAAGRSADTYAPAVMTVVIPYRGDAKRRLPPELRAAAAVAMLGDVVEVALPLGRVVVVTDDPVVVPRGAELLPIRAEGKAQPW